MQEFIEKRELNENLTIKANTLILYDYTVVAQAGKIEFPFGGEGSGKTLVRIAPIPGFAPDTIRQTDRVCAERHN